MRQLFGLDADRKVAFLIDEQDKTVRLAVPRYPTIASIVGAAGALNKKMSFDEMPEIARTDALGKSYPKGGD